MIKTPNELWKDFDPNSVPLDISEIKTTESDGIITRHFMFTGREFSCGTKSRIYGIVSYKKTQQYKESLIIINDPKDRIDLAQLNRFAKNNFLAMAIDYKGQGDVGRFTLYPEDIDYCNYNEQNINKLFSTAEETMWYEYALNTMRAITLLNELNLSKTVSVMSAFSGSLIGLMVSAIDTRVVRSSVLFGNLHQEESFIEYENTSELSDNELKNINEHNEKIQAWQMGVAPQSYVPLIKTPIYVVCTANSKSVDVNMLSECFYRTSDESRLLILPGFVDYVPTEIADGIVKWFEGYTIVDDIELTVFEEEEDIVDEIEEEEIIEVVDVSKQLAMEIASAELDNIEVWYSRDKSQNWNKTTPFMHQSGKLVANIELYEGTKEVSVIAIKNGYIKISTTIIKINDCQKYIQLPTTSLLYTGESDTRLVAFSTDSFWYGDLRADVVTGYLDIVGTAGCNLATFSTKDVRIDFTKCDTISFDVQSDVKQELTIKIIADYGKNTESYFLATVQLVGNGKWQQVVLTRDDCERTDDAIIKIEDIEVITFSAKEKIILNNIYVV